MRQYTIYDGQILVNEGKHKSTYYYRTTIDGQRKKINLGHDKNLAVQKLREIETHGSIQPKTVNDIWEKYSRDDLLQRAKKTQLEYQKSWKMIKKIFGHMKLADIRRGHVINYISNRKSYLVDKAKDDQKLNAGVAANREIALLSILFNYAINVLEYNDVFNPCYKLKERRVKEKGREKCLDGTEFYKIYEAGDQTLRNVLDMLLISGQRIGDILKLKTTDIRRNVDLTKSIMPNGEKASVEIGLDRADLMKILTNKTKKLIDIVIEGELKEIIDRIYEQRKNKGFTSEFLICDSENKSFTYYQIERKFKVARKRAGFKAFEIQMRDLRRTNATMDTLVGANIRLGHKTMAMTEKYRDNVIGVIARPTDKLEKE